MAELPKSGKKRSANHGLPDEILIEIFSRLRVKTLCKFKCVCKQWEKLISDPYFHVLHHQRSQKKPMLLFLENRLISCSKETPGKKDLLCVDLDGEVSYSMSLPRLPLPENSTDYFVVVPSSCRNLICLVTRKSFFLCNPSIQEFVGLPEPTCNLHNASNPLYVNRPRILLYPRMTGGCGFVEAKNESVIIHLITDHKRSYIGCEVLNFSAGNLGCGSWRKIDKIFPHDHYAYHPWGTFVDGAFYWKHFEDEHEKIISFNLQSENFETLPPPLGIAGKDLYFVEHKGNLALVNVSAEMVNLWTLKGSENKTWTKDFSIDFEAFCYRIDFFNPMEEIDGELLVILHHELEKIKTSGKRSVGYYNRHKKCFRKLENVDIPVQNERLRLHTDTLFSFRSRN